MPGAVFEYLAGDHDRLDALLSQATVTPGTIEMALYGEFREGLLRHIAIEEKIVFPAIARLSGGVSSSLPDRLRLDHGALAALLVPPPTPAIVQTLLSILPSHNALEEAEGGVYQLLDRLAGNEAEELVGRMKAQPAVRTMPYNRRPEVLEATHRALARAGYRMKSGEAMPPPDGTSG